MSGYEVRRLTHADLPQFRRLRLEALRAHPDAFGSSFEEERHDPLAAFGRFVPASPPGAAYGAFMGPHLVGMATVTVPTRLKESHKGIVASVYVAPEHRRAGLARQLMQTLITDAAASGLVTLRLSVTVGNDAAYGLYFGLGFRPYGIEPRARRINGAWYDDTLMGLDLA